MLHGNAHEGGTWSICGRHIAGPFESGGKRERRKTKKRLALKKTTTTTGKETGSWSQEMPLYRPVVREGGETGKEMFGWLMSGGPDDGSLRSGRPRKSEEREGQSVRWTFQGFDPQTVKGEVFAASAQSMYEKALFQQRRICFKARSSSSRNLPTDAELDSTTAAFLMGSCASFQGTLSNKGIGRTRH
jgi:hypothetical protein